MKTYPLAEGKERWIKGIKGVRTGEFRNPLKGEWYLSGAIPECWKAPNNLTTPFYIIRLVKVVQIEKIVTEIITEYIE